MPSLVVLTGILLVVGAAWGYRDARRAQSELAAARDTMRGVAEEPSTLATPDGRAAARASVDSALGRLATARRRVADSPVLSVLGRVPGLSAQRRGLLRLLDDGTVAATVGGDLLAKVDAMAEQTSFRDGVVPVDGIRVVAGDLEATATRLRRLVRSSAGLWGPVRDARGRFDEITAETSDRLVEGSDAMRAALMFVGAAGDRRHLLALQNNAEMRDQGMVLQYAVVRFSGGRLGLERNGSVFDLRLDRPTSTPLPAGTQEVFGPLRPTELWQSVNATADFATSGRVMADMFRQATGTPVDGVVGIDVQGLAALLGVVGPVQVPGLPEPITAENAGRVLVHDLYEGLPPVVDATGRRERLGEVTRAVVERLTNGAYNAIALGRALGDSARGGHLRVWSPLDEEEKSFKSSGLGGSPGSKSPERTFHLAVQNRSATKLDYFVRPRVRQDIQVTPDGSAVVRTTVFVDNQARPGQPPSYRLGPDGNTRNPGDYLAWLLLWGPPQARQTGGVSESGLLLSQHVMAVPAGQQRELTFTTVVPDAVRNGEFSVRLVPQPRLVPVDLEVRIAAREWDVEGAASWAGPWDRVLNFRWRLSR